MLKIKNILFTIVLILSSLVSFSKRNNTVIDTSEKYNKLLSTADSLYFKGEWQKAIPYYSKALADTSTNALLWQRLAYAHYMGGNFESSLKYYKRSLAFKPNPILQNIIYTNILKIYEKLKKSKEAIGFINEAAEAGFSNSLVIDSLVIFNPYKNDTTFKRAYNKILTNAYPCLKQAHRNDYDFWIGEWDVYITGTQNLVGKSSITKTDGGCVVLEHFTSIVALYSGHSISFLDLASGKWQQTYSGSSGGHQLYINGEYFNGAMHFTYDANYGKPVIGNFIFYNLAPDLVRQYQEYSLDGGKTFIVGYDYTYKRKK